MGEFKQYCAISSQVLAKRSLLAGSIVFINNDLTKEQMQAEKQLREIKKKLLQLQGKKGSIYRDKIWVNRSPVSEDMLHAAGISH